MGQSNRCFKTFPKQLERYLPNLIIFHLWDCGISSISSDDLAPWPDLMQLSLDTNRITTLDGDLFQHSPKLVKIELNFNLIRGVGADLLSNLNELRYASFVENPCINAYAATPHQLEALKAKLVNPCEPNTKNINYCDSINDVRGMFNKMFNQRGSRWTESKNWKPWNARQRVNGKSLHMFFVIQ